MNVDTSLTKFTLREGIKMDYDSAANTRWRQSSGIMPSIIFEISDLGSNALKVFLCLVHCSNCLGACVISHKTIAKVIHSSTRTVYRNLKKLSNHGFISILDIGEQTNVYITNPDLIWQESRKNAKLFAKFLHFPATVVLSSDSNRIRAITKELNLAKRKSHRSFDINNIKSENVYGIQYSYQDGKLQNIKMEQSDESTKHQFKVQQKRQHEDREAELVKLEKKEKLLDRKYKSIEQELLMEKHNNKQGHLSKIKVEQKDTKLGH